MKKLLALLLVVTICLMTFVCSASAVQAKVMASFYPMYIFALNVFDGIDGISVRCMTAPQTGCLHDYQLVVRDMLNLADADMFIVCGAGMEVYLPDVQAQFADLPVVDCSVGIELICDDEEDEHEHEESDHGHHGHDHSVNAHTWLDINNAIVIVRTIAENGMALFPEAAEQISANAQGYIARLEALNEELSEALAPVAGQQIVTFHEAFPYFAQAFRLEIAAVITQEHDEALSPAQITHMIDVVRKAGNPPLFTEPQYTSYAAQTIAGETGAKVFELDPIVTGEASLTAYEDGMRRNAEAILKAFE